MLRKLGSLVMVIVCASAMLHGCDRPQDATPTSENALVAEAANSVAEAFDVPRVTWPPLQEDDVVTNAPVAAAAIRNYYIVLDGSGSMLSRECGDGKSKIDAALDAIKRFIASVPADTNVGLAAFDRRAISERVPLGVGNRDALYGALKNIRAGSDTPLRSSIKIGYDKLTEQARAQLGYGEYHLVVVTDGNPDPANEDPTPVINEILSQSPVVVHTVGFCIDDDHVLNQPNRTYYASATNPDELQQGLQAVLAEAPTFDAAKFSN